MAKVLWSVMLSATKTIGARSLSMKVKCAGSFLNHAVKLASINRSFITEVKITVIANGIVNVLFKRILTILHIAPTIICQF